MHKIETNRNGTRAGRCARRGATARGQIAAFLLGALVFLLPQFAAAEPEDCKSLLAMGAQNKIPDKYLLSPGLRLEAQKGLETVYSGNAAYEAEVEAANVLSDARIGSVTRKWLESFCVDFPVYGTPEEVPDAVMRSALHYAEIAAKYPTWKQILGSGEFDDWVGGSSDGAEAGLRRIRRSGAAMVVTRLLDEFSAAQGSGDQKAPADGDEASCKVLLRGGKDNKIPRKYLNSAATRRNIQRGLQAVYFGNPEYRAELEGTSLLSDGKIGKETRRWLERFCRDFPVSGLTENVPDRVVRSALHYAEIAAARADWKELIADPGFNAWIRDPVPDGEQANRPLRLSGSAPVVIELIAAYPGRAAPPAPVISDACPVAASGAAIYYQLTAQDLESLKARKDFLDQALALVGKSFNTEAELEQAIGPAATLLQSECPRQRFLATIQENKRTETIGYRLTPRSLQLVRTGLKPPAELVGDTEILFVEDMISALGELQDQVYDTLDELAQFVRFTVTFALSDADAAASDSWNVPQPKPASRKTQTLIELVVEQVVKTAEPVSPYLIVPEAIDALSTDPLFVSVPEPLVTKLESLTGVAYANDRLFATAVQSLLKQVPAAEDSAGSDGDKAVAGGTGSYVQAIVAQARKEAQAESPLRLTAGDCGCARQLDSVVSHFFTVYGFFPFWMSGDGAEETTEAAPDADTEPAAEQSQDASGGPAVDFGVLSRIGYFALELDDKGNLTDRRLWSLEDGAGAFLAEAHRYRSKVDLVIEARHWQRWDKATLQRSVESIWGLIDPDSAPAAMLPDGIAIYFPDFPEHLGNRDRIVTLVTQLRKRMDDLGDGRELALNIVIDAGRLELDNAIDYSGESRLLGGLDEILVDRQGSPVMVDLLLVFLGQPVTDMKKRLRLAVENEFSGEARTNVLRKILPIVPPNGHQGEAVVPTECHEEQGTNDPYWQLQHDLVYFRDNFRGVAFWPLLTEKDEESSDLDERLRCTFAKSKTGGVATQVLETMMPGLCQFVCPNRHPLWYVAAALFGLLMLLALLAYFSCQVRSAIAKRFLYPLAGVLVLILLAVPLITCDPKLNEQEPTILMTLVGILLTSWLLHYVRTVKQGPLP